MFPTCVSAALTLASLASSVLGQQYGAAELIPQGLMPRYGAAAPPLPVAKRDGAPCNPDHHLCNDIGVSDQCCANTQYCYIKPDFSAWCCDIGSNCDSNCNATAFQCSTTVTDSGTTSTSSACCPRQCTSTSQFLCVSSLGGNCCNYGATCAVGGLCVATATSSAPLLVPAGTQSCTATTQHACTDGAPGCCDDSSRCTLVSGTAYCAAVNTSVSDITVEPHSGLSDGAKAGIGAGIAIGACVIIGAVTWMCIRKRGERRRTERARSRDEAMTEITDESRPQPLQGLTQDYSGPEAEVGPFTETDATTAATTPALPRAVPTQPQAPEDITAPVEIDSRMRSTNDNLRTVPIIRFEITPETTEGRFELHGSEIPPP